MTVKMAAVPIALHGGQEETWFTFLNSLVQALVSQIPNSFRQAYSITPSKLHILLPPVMSTLYMYLYLGSDGQFQCSSGGCIDIHWTCDRREDCYLGDLSDEDGCNTCK